MNYRETVATKGKGNDGRWKWVNRAYLYPAFRAFNGPFSAYFVRGSFKAIYWSVRATAASFWWASSQA